jgi:hypothetical protein
VECAKEEKKGVGSGEGPVGRRFQLAGEEDADKEVGAGEESLIGYGPKTPTSP